PALPVRVAVDRLAVGTLSVHHNREPLPVDVGNFSAAVYLYDTGGQLVLQSLDVAHEQLEAGFSGELKLLGLRAPWPLEIQLSTRARGLTADSPLCARHYLSTLPAQAAAPEAVQPASAEQAAQQKRAADQKPAVQAQQAAERKNAAARKD